MKKVFLGGTCGNSTWRDELMPLLKIDYFNPVVKNWTKECQEIEEFQKEKLCNVHLYVITKEMSGVFSIAEVIDSVHNKNVTTILIVNIDGFEGHQVKSLNAVVDLVNKRGGTAKVSSDIKDVADILNGLTEIKKISSNDPINYPIINAHYNHYKGGRYTVIAIGKYTVNNEVVVLCKSEVFCSYHVRPLKEWFEEVTVNNTDSKGTMKVKRFNLSGY
jgi:hypothetical protein